VNILSKMYGGNLRPADPRRFLIEAIVGAMQADGVVKKEELEVLETNLAEHEMFAGLSGRAAKALVEMASESIAFAGGPLRRVPYMARGLPSRAHRLAAYAVACEITLADGEIPAPGERAYLDLLKGWFLLGEEEAKGLFDAAKRKRGMHEVEDRTRHMQQIMPINIQCMALMAAADGQVTHQERNALLGVLRNVGDMAVMEEDQIMEAVDKAFRAIEGTEPDRQIAKVARGLEQPSDRYWAMVYMMIIAIADGYSDWRQVWLLGSAQDAMGLSDQQMDRAMATAKLFPVGKA
jgi:uncharacterized tellurite resistance protein B-like protein